MKIVLAEDFARAIRRLISDESFSGPVTLSSPNPLPKSRRVVPGRLLEAGFEFAFPEWADAARDLVSRRA